ncbi:hypothetical protein C9374_009138 [Naegleria lovaniensis]|uniref:HMG box domain-containing protein n=1 Tax=Naegleria lovaniensis TaxID=51637 RepID=A0AA88KEM2_NAELO|nr:uncharacterized protein C9374_009138 [Naegleria lovaniensis]KAG2377622.1 hypothetical protein C9374_009138 [Naegleria lovaniensis]
MPPKKQAEGSDDEKPKQKVPTAYALYCQDNMERVKKENEGKKQSEIKKILSSEWKEADEQTKEKYNTMHKKAKAEANGEEYDSSATKRKRATKGESSKKAKKDDEEGGEETPKKTPTAYALFCTEKTDEVKKSDSSLKASEVKKKLSEMWKSMSKEEKKPYEEQSKKLKPATPKKAAKKKDEDEDEEGSEEDDE